MPFLMEVNGRHRTTLAPRVFRFTDLPGGYNTQPGDEPANVHFAPRIDQAGLYRRTLFGSGGRTNGVAEVDRGQAVLVNTDGGLDAMLDHAFDGQPMTIWQIEGKRSPYASRVRLTTGTMEQVSVTWEAVTLNLRSRLAVLDVPIEPTTYLGTSIDATRRNAEGGEDLKGAPRLVLYGRQRNMPALMLNRFHGLYGVGQRLGQVFSVRNRGVKLEPTGQDHPTIEALISANITEGRWATCLALGLIRLGGNVNANGVIMVDAAEGASVAARTAGQVVRRILVDRAKLVPNVDFLEADIAALDAAASYELGFWAGTQRVTVLAVLSEVLDSVRAWISPDRNGVFRIGQLRAPAGNPVRVFDKTQLLDEEGSGLRRLPTGDEGRGLPASKIIVRHSRNHAVTTRDNLAGAGLDGDPAFAAFVEEEWRQAEAVSPGAADLHPLAVEMVFSTCLVHAADAAAEAVARQALYGVQRDHYAITVRTEHAAMVDLGREVGIRIARFGLGEGRSFVVVGMMENHEEGTTTMDAWG